MRGALVRRARHWVENRGWGGLAKEMMRRLRMKMRGEVEGEREVAVARHPFDERYGVDTSGLIWGEKLSWEGGLQTEQERTGAMWATGYYGIAPSAFEAIMASLGLEWDRYSFVDVGCGKGRALLMATAYPFRQVVGVELSPELARVAQENVLRLKADWRRPMPVTVVAGDATTVDLPDGPLLLYLYHPFAAPVMRAFLRHVRDAAAGREVVMLYVNAELDGLVVAELPGTDRLWGGGFALSREDAEADRFGSHDERAVAYRLAL